MPTRRDSFNTALRLTIPVMTGYIFLGFAFGLFAVGKGLGFVHALMMSVFIYAGSMQFVAVGLLTSIFQPVYAFFLTLIINARHLFYGVSMLERFGGTGKIKPYLIFGLTDETFSILCSTPVPEGNEGKRLMLYITLLDQLYWVTGTVLGAIAGTLIKFNAEGIEFVMTALFTVIFINQWLSRPEHAPAIIGVAASVVCLAVFGASGFIIPAMLSMTALLCACKKKIESGMS